MSIATYYDILRVVSALRLPCNVEAKHRHIVAAIGDRIVAPRNPVLLSQHWDVPVTWYPARSPGIHPSCLTGREARG